jgi:hypothetical protein
MTDRIITFNSVDQKILILRDQQVILDSDVALLYHVETKRINEAVKNNPDKFPPGYILELTDNEWNELKSKFSTSIKGGKVKLPNAFTERGLYMLATILKSTIATQTTLAIVEAFSKIKELNRTITSLTEIDNAAKQQSLLKKTSNMISDLIGNAQHVTNTETTIELNFAVLKLKHTVKRKNDE